MVVTAAARAAAGRVSVVAPGSAAAARLAHGLLLPAPSPPAFRRRVPVEVAAPAAEVAEGVVRVAVEGEGGSQNAECRMQNAECRTAIAAALWWSSVRCNDGV